MTEIVTGRGTLRNHLPPMTDAEFRAYMTAQEAVAAANRQVYAAAYAAGAAACKRGAAMATAATPDDHNRNSLAWTGWHDGYAAAQEDEPADDARVEGWPMTTLTTAGYIVHDNEGVIHGIGATADSAWADMQSILEMANIKVVTDDFDASDYEGSWLRESDLRLAPATQALLDLVKSHGGDCRYAKIGGVACTRDEEG